VNQWNNLTDDIKESKKIKNMSPEKYRLDGIDKK